MADCKRERLPSNHVKPRTCETDLLTVADVTYGRIRLSQDGILGRIK